MLQPETVVAALRSKGELWEPLRGLAGMRGATARLMSSVSSSLARMAMLETSDEWRMPSGISFETLERARYFESFPGWLTAASHLRNDDAVLERVARSEHPGREAADALDRAESALSPAVCYHAYAELAGSVIQEDVIITAEETCWRHEGSRLAALERGWAFRMREIVFLGSPVVAEEFRQRGIEQACAFAKSLGLPASIELASDPFFAPTSHGKALLQRVKALKHELVIDYGGDNSVAIASFNKHERFFGEAFDICLPDGSPVTTACVAFGVERWMLAIMMVHGTNAANWPEVKTEVAEAAA